MRQLIERLIASTTHTIVAHADELTTRDQAIGDGDHGINLKRGFEAVRDAADDIAARPFGAALHKAGMTLVLKVGGASGPLYGSLLMAMGKAAAETPASAAAVATVLGAGITAVKERGRSDAGDKTMLDVLIPIQQALAADAERPIAELVQDLRSVATAAMEATRPLQARKGRASFLGERSIGHVDPGARSSALLVNAVCDVVEEIRK